MNINVLRDCCMFRLLNVRLTVTLLYFLQQNSSWRVLQWGEYKGHLSSGDHIQRDNLSLQFIIIFVNNTAAGEVTRVGGGNEIITWFTELSKWTGAGEWRTHFICISLHSIMLYRTVQGSGTLDCEFTPSWQVYVRNEYRWTPPPTTFKFHTVVF
jgi:hypothetical protein